MILVRFKPRNILLVDNSTNYWTTVLTVHCIQDRYKVILFSGGWGPQFKKFIHKCKKQIGILRELTKTQ